LDFLKIKLLDAKFLENLAYPIPGCSLYSREFFAVTMPGFTSAVPA
jgi:hypothetical protein